jgi:hypothetical protein
MLAMHDDMARIVQHTEPRLAELQPTAAPRCEPQGTRGLAAVFLRQRLDLLLQTRGLEPAAALTLSEVKQHLVTRMDSAVKPNGNEHLRALHLMLPLLLLGMSRDMAATPAQAEMKIARMTVMQRGKA